MDAQNDKVGPFVSGHAQNFDVGFAVTDPCCHRAPIAYRIGREGLEPVRRALQLLFGLRHAVGRRGQPWDGHEHRAVGVQRRQPCFVPPCHSSRLRERVSRGLREVERTVDALDV